MNGFPGYERLIGPETLPIGGRFVRTPRDYVICQHVNVMIRGARSWPTQVKVQAYINAGRWVARCHWCSTAKAVAMLTRPDWGIACCFECGAVYNRGSVIFPDAELLAAVVPLLLKRPSRDHQNWGNPHIDRPIQSPADVELENREVLQLC